VTKVIKSLLKQFLVLKAFNTTKLLAPYALCDDPIGFHINAQLWLSTFIELLWIFRLDILDAWELILELWICGYVPNLMCWFRNAPIKLGKSILHMSIVLGSIFTWQNCSRLFLQFQLIVTFLWERLLLKIISSHHCKIVWI